jgi:competence ComEA-like helix-hairpin-helix protein
MLRTLLVLTAILLVAPVFAQDDGMPEAPGKGATVRICTGCHGAEMWAGSNKSGDDWDRTITTMTEKGLSISDADYSTVLDYLSTCLGPNSPKVNINKAAACELTRLLGISQQAANAIVAARVKNGNFKDLDSVKKVEGVDGSALDAKKDAITF